MPLKSTSMSKSAVCAAQAGDRAQPADVLAALIDGKRS
jgi:hypothetical protein